VLDAFICMVHARYWVDFSTGMDVDDGIGLRRSLYSGGRNSLTRMLLMNHSIADLTQGSNSPIHLSRYLCDGRWGRVASFGPCGFSELFSHKHSENFRSSGIVLCPRGMNVPVVILVKLPGFSNVDSFVLRSKSRLSYANAHRPSSPRFLMIC